MTYRQLLQYMAGTVPFEGENAARALETSLEVVLSLLTERMAHALLATLPDAPQILHDAEARLLHAQALAGPPQAARHSPVSSPALAARMGELLDVPESRGLETLQVVCGLLSRFLPPDVRHDLLRELPQDVVAWFAEPSHYDRAPAGVGRGHSLADGRSGSTHPLSESAPGSRQSVARARPRAGQTHSVAENNPHSETKLSSARGLTQEREHESLSEAQKRQ